MEKAPALVTYPPNGTNINLKYQNVTVNTDPSSLGPHDVLIDIVASGICHSDIVIASIPVPDLYPRILGHEGAGYVRAIGSNVKTAKPGDAVLLSFASCRECNKCKTDHPAYCPQFNALNIYDVSTKFSLAEEDVEAKELGREEVTGGFFGQSSFAKLAKVNESSIVNVTDKVKSKEELRLFAPMGCGFQTGAAACVIEAGCTAEDTVAVIGLGGVGLAALMAAKIKGCKTIIGIDLVQSRLDIATSIGATHTVQSGSDLQELEDGVKKILPEGVSLVIDTTGIAPVVEVGLKFTSDHGRFVLIGIPKRDATLMIQLNPFLVSAKKFMGTIEGDAKPQDFIPQMIEWYRAGQFPIDKFIKFFPAEDFQKALGGMHDGTTIKPVLTW